MKLSIQHNVPCQTCPWPGFSMQDETIYKKLVVMVDDEDDDFGVSIEIKLR